MNNPLQTLMDLHAKTTQKPMHRFDNMVYTSTDMGHNEIMASFCTQHKYATQGQLEAHAKFTAAAHNLLPALAAYVAELEARALPVLPEGYEWVRDQVVFIVPSDNRSFGAIITGNGPTPADAIRNAIKQVEG